MIEIVDATETVEIADLTVDVTCTRLEGVGHPVTMTATDYMNRFVAGAEDKATFVCDSPACIAAATA